MRRFNDPTLYCIINGRLVSQTLCTSNYHANNIIRDLMFKYDPFLRY